MVGRAPERACGLVCQHECRKAVAKPLCNVERPEVHLTHVSDHGAMRTKCELATTYLLYQPAMHVMVRAEALEAADGH
jgi:hypothetical protein